MVHQNRLDYGFNGYQVPPIPRAARSIRRRGTFRNRVDDKQMNAFDLLASVAGNLLLEGCSSPSSSIANDTASVQVIKSDEGALLKEEPSYQQYGQEPAVYLTGQDQYCNTKANSYSNEGCLTRFSPELMVSNASKNIADENLASTMTNRIGNAVCKIDVGSQSYSWSCDQNLDSGNNPVAVVKVESETCRSKDPVVCEQKPQTLVGSENGFGLPLWEDHGPQCSHPTGGVDVKVLGRGYEDDTFGCTLPSTSRNSFRKSPHIGGQRIRKILASKNWKANVKYGSERPNSGGYTRQIYFKRRNSCKNQRSQMNIPFKKRKLFDGCFSNCNGGKITEGISHSTNRGRRKYSAHRRSSLVAGHRGDSRVKLRIKSFRVPELFIEIPETATVSSLKRMVMEAVTTIVGRGIHVGVLIRGKKVRDDNKTLFQTGISHDNQDDSLGFTLEPQSSQALSSLCQAESPLMSPCSSTPEPLTRRLPDPGVDYPGGNGTLLLEADTVNLSNSIGSDLTPMPSLANTRVEKSSADSKALVTVPAMCLSGDALAVVPVGPKPKRLEIGQRRIRRPFSVAEVESLVHAVETFGTGRWRDVKLRAFDNASHRTYVDLKDKWKTLVHTARISPQQRRGEPVPQELLDRVLNAHSYWSQHQVKQQQQQQQHPIIKHHTH